MPTVAIMQPYFFPYAGYYRLMAACDEFVIFDCVQFPRRGFVHRNRLRTDTGNLNWFTLPLRKADYHARIDELRFADDAASSLRARASAFPALRHLIRQQTMPELMSLLFNPEDPVVSYLERTMRFVAKHLNFRCQFRLSSSLNLPSCLKGQDRILAIAGALHAERYINPSGGRHLYDKAIFAEHGIKLSFFTGYQGDLSSMLERLLTEPAQQIAADIRSSVDYC